VSAADISQLVKARAECRLTRELVASVRELRSPRPLIGTRSGERDGEHSGHGQDRASLRHGQSPYTRSRLNTWGPVARDALC
jgi:hypothetical protein